MLAFAQKTAILKQINITKFFHNIYNTILNYY